MIVRVHLFSYYCFVKYYNYPINKYVINNFFVLNNDWLFCQIGDTVEFVFSGQIVFEKKF